MEKSPLHNLLTRKTLLIGFGVLAIASIILVVLSDSEVKNRVATVTPTPKPVATEEPQVVQETPIQPDKQVEGQIVVKFNARLTDAQINDILKKYNATIDKKIEGINYTVVKVPKGQENAIIQQLKNEASVEDAQGDYTNHLMYTPNDQYFLNQYGLNNTGQTIQNVAGKATADVRAVAAWDVTKGNGVKVAVLDTGINLNHPDLSAKIVAQKAFGQTTVEDNFGHGTHVAGIIAASTNNSAGVAGACPDCQLIIGKVMGDDGTGTTSNITAGITWAADQGAKVINLSLGTTSASSATLYQQAIDYAVGKGAIVVAAAGNCGGSNFSSNGCTTQNQTNYPGASNNVITVGSTDNKDAKSSFSNYGTTVEVAAPGTNIISTLPNHANAKNVMNYGYMSGTSMATPLASGIIALIWSSQYGTSAAAVTERLYATVDPIAGTGQYWTKGRINAAKAVGAGTTPSPTIAPSAVTPTYVCAGSPDGTVCPPTPTVAAGGATPTTGAGGGSPAPTNTTTNPPVGGVNPTTSTSNPGTQPCESTNSVQYSKNRVKSRGGFIEMFMQFIFRFIELLLQKLGISIPGFPDPGTSPSPTPDPGDDDPGTDPSPTPCPDPTDEPDDEPTTAPTTATQPTQAGQPTTAASVAPTVAGGGNAGDPTATTCGGSANTPGSPVTGYTISKCEDFNGSSMPSSFSPYNGGGESTVVGGGRKSSQCTVGGGMLTLAQAADGSTCGGSTDFGQKYGYWEVRMRVTSTGSGGSAPHPVLILWPDTNVWADGELDYFESDIGDSEMGVFLHCVGNPSSNCYSTKANVDVAQWHVYGFEWTSAGFVGYVDGKQIYTTDGKGSNPSVSMHQTIQLDNLSGKTPVSPGKMEIDWMHMYKK